MLTAANINSEMGLKYFIKNYHYQGKSRWSGEAACRLKLSGTINDEQVFLNVIEGRSPDGTQQLNAKLVKADKRRAALDCTFSAPKSVSLMALVGGDEKLISAHQAAIREVLTLIEQRYTFTRVTEGNSRQRKNTNNLVVAEFDHIESRELDPHLHTHCLLMNMTQTEDGDWMSLNNSEIFAHKKLLGMVYQSHLAQQVQQLGYKIEPLKHGQFEIKGFKQQDLIEFSKRRQQILASVGVNSSWAERNRAWDITRTSKQKISSQELKTRWQLQAAELGINFVNPTELEDEPVVESTNQKSLQQALNDAIAHWSQKKVAFSVEELESFVLQQRLATDFSEIEPLIKKQSGLIRLPNLQNQHTTWSAVERELATIKLMQHGQGAVNPICDSQIIENFLEKTSLDIDQRQAVQMVTTTVDQFVAWQEIASNHKTLAKKQLLAIANSAGYIVKAFTSNPMNKKVLGEQLDIQTQTVAFLLVSQPPQSDESNQIWIVDEAELLTASDTHALLQRATQQKARLLLVGDTKHRASQTGNPFKSLQQAGIKTAYLGESNRLRNPELKIAKDLIAKGSIEDGFKQLETIGSIQLVTDDTKISRIAAEYMALPAQQRAGTLVLAANNTERVAITQAIRAKLKDEGSLGTSVILTQLQTKKLSRIQSRYTHNFALGDVVAPMRNYKRRTLEKGKLYQVVGKDIDQLTLKASDGTAFEVDTNFDKAVYHTEQIEIALGDRLAWKKNDKQLQQRNGQEFVVTAIEGNNAQIRYLDDGRTEILNLNQAQNLDYAYASTVHSNHSSGKQRVLFSANHTITSSSFYAALRQAKHNIKFFTQDKQQLLELAQKSKFHKNGLDVLTQQLQQRQKQQQAVALTPTIEKEQTHEFNRQQPNSDTVINREDREIKYENRPVGNHQLEAERQNSTIRNSSIREPERVKSESLELLAAISRYLELQEVEQLGTDIARVNQSLRDCWVRGQGTTILSTNINRQNSGIIDCKQSHGSFEQQAPRQLLDAICNFKDSVTTLESTALVKSLQTLIENLQYRQNQQLQTQQQQTLWAIANFIDQSSVESALAEALSSQGKQFSHPEQLAKEKTTFNQFVGAISQNQQTQTQQQTSHAIANFVDQSFTESALAESLSSVTQQFSKYQQQLANEKATFNQFAQSISQRQLFHTQQQTSHAIANFIDQSFTESALVEALPSVNQQFSEYQQQLANEKATFNQLAQAISQRQLFHTQQQTSHAIANFIDQSSTESVLAEALPSVTQQFFEVKQQVVNGNATFNQLAQAISQRQLFHTQQQTSHAIANFIDQSSTESVLAEALLSVTQQFSEVKQQLADEKATYDQLIETISQSVEIPVDINVDEQEQLEIYSLLNELTDQELLCLEQAVKKYFSQRVAQAPPHLDQQALKTQIHQFETQIRSLWQQHATQEKAIKLMERYPLHQLSNKYNKALDVQLETINNIQQLFNSKQQLIDQIKQWETQVCEYQTWEEQKETYEMKLLANTLNSPDFQKRLSSIKEELKQSQQSQDKSEYKARPRLRR